MCRLPPWHLLYFIIICLHLPHLSAYNVSSYLSPQFLARVHSASPTNPHWPPDCPSSGSGSWLSQCHRFLTRFSNSQVRGCSDCHNRNWIITVTFIIVNGAREDVWVYMCHSVCVYTYRQIFTHTYTKCHQRLIWNWFPEGIMEIGSFIKIIQQE